MKRSLSLLIVAAAFLAQGCGTANPAENPKLPTGQPPTANPTVPPSAEATAIVHVSPPAGGTRLELSFHDNDESTTFQDKDVRKGDQYKVNHFERPFTAGTMDYLPFVDIKEAGIASDETWYYLQLAMAGFGEGKPAIQATYGAEFDVNMDGRAEILVLADPPFSTEWSTDGVAVYWDQNGDIGGERLYPDAHYTGDGYETVLVSSGAGDDPDLAWARLVSADKPVVELAFKRIGLANFTTFMWDVLASARPVDPTKLYYNDTIAPAKAGSPKKVSELYPLKALWGFDNTCRFAFGFQEIGTEPMSCRSFNLAADGSSGETAGGGGQTSGGGNDSSGGGDEESDPPDLVLKEYDAVPFHLCPPFDRSCQSR